MKFKSCATINLFLMSGYRIIAKKICNLQTIKNLKANVVTLRFLILFILTHKYLHNFSYKFFFRVSYFFQVHQPVIHFIAITYRQ